MLPTVVRPVSRLPALHPGDRAAVETRCRQPAGGPQRVETRPHQPRDPVCAWIPLARPRMGQCMGPSRTSHPFGS